MNLQIIDIDTLLQINERATVLVRNAKYQEEYMAQIARAACSQLENAGIEIEDPKTKAWWEKYQADAAHKHALELEAAEARKRAAIRFDALQDAVVSDLSDDDLAFLRDYKINQTREPSHHLTAPVETFLETLYQLAARDSDLAIDQLFECMDDWFNARDYERCNDMLMIVEPEKLNLYVLIAMLSVTRRAAPYLPARVVFVAKVTAIIVDTAPDRAQRLLSGLI